MSAVDLRVDWCSYEAAKYAVEHWHYSKTMPIGKIVRVGVWEDNEFIGCVLFARGNTPTLGDAYGLEMVEVCELVRIALKAHKHTVSQIASKAIKMLKEQSLELRLIVSFADPKEGHNGAIYQAMNWIYTGKSADAKQWFINGDWKHNREVTSGAFGGAHLYPNYRSAESRIVPGKYRYLYPLDRAMRRQIEPLRKPYPKREPCGQSVNGDTIGDQPVEAGSIPAVRSDFSTTENNRNG